MTGDWQAQAEVLRQSFLYGFYVAPEAASQDLLANLALNKLILFGGETPTDAEVRARWAATIHSDLSSGMQSAWNAAMSGGGGQVVDAPLQIVDVNPTFLGSGRMQRLMFLAEQLQRGLVYAYTIPAQ